MALAFFAHDLCRKPVPALRDHTLTADGGFILLVGDVLHPIHVLAVQRLLGRDMNHGRGRSGAMPVLLVWRNPDDIAALYFAHLAAPALHAARTGNDEQGLAERMRMPGRPCAGLEADQTGPHARR